MAEKKRLSLYENHNCFQPENCHVGVFRRNHETEQIDNFIIKPAKGLSLKFYILGGSDAPCLQLQLKFRDPDAPALTMTGMSLLCRQSREYGLTLIEASFLPWASTGSDTARAQVIITSDQPSNEVFTFSDRLEKLCWAKPVFNNSESRFLMESNE